MASSSHKAFPLVFRGIELKTEPSLLTDGQFWACDNVASLYEGGLSPRLGSVLEAGFTTADYVFSIHKMSLGGADAANPRYLGDATNLIRVTGPYSTPVNVGAGLSLADRARWEAKTFNAGDSGTPISFFAHPSRPMRDNGAYSVLLPWGIAAPERPVTAVPGPTGFAGAVTPLAGTSRLTITVSSFAQVLGTYYRIFPSSLVGIVPGMLFTSSGSAVDVIVDSVDAISFFADFPASAPTNGMSLDSSYTPIAGLIADGTTFTEDFAASVDWALSAATFPSQPATPDFSSNDNVHIGLYIDNPACISEIRVRILVNGSTTDYYEKAISISPLQAYINTTQTAITTQIAYSAQVAAAAAGSSSITSQQLQPVAFPPIVSPTWFEFDVPKNLFNPVGNAGNSPYSWDNVTGLEIAVITLAVAGTPSFNVWVGQVYASGGGGLDSLSLASETAYSYVTTVRNPITNEEGNPTPLQVNSAWLSVYNRPIVIGCPGVETNPLIGTPQGGNPLIAGFGSVSVYRAGGTFADSIYRFVGYATNPGRTGGVPNVTLFTDNNSDSQIADADAVQFDNYGPVASSLPNQFSATISVLTNDGNGFFTITPTGWTGPSDLTTFLNEGSTLTVGTGDNQETCVIAFVTSTTLIVWLQNPHLVGDPLVCNAVVNQPCDVICQAGDAVLLAGDKNNPHIVYRSKAGAPAAFPIINLETGNSHQQIIGSPDNPINGLVDYGGWYVSLNLENISTFQIWLGAFANVTTSPSSRGLTVKNVFCKVGTSIWFLSYDGIYAWAGGSEQKMTESLDQIFRGIAVGVFQPVDYTQTNFMHLFYYQNTVWFIYMDTASNLQTIRYNTLYKRWEPTNFNYTKPMTCLLVEEDTGRMIGAADSLYEMEKGNSDNGSSISWGAITGWYAPEGKTVNKQNTEVMIELQNPSDSVTVNVWYDYSTTPDPVDQFVIAPGSARRFVPLPLGVAIGASNGKEARVIAIELLGNSTSAVTVFSIQFSYNILTEIQRGRVTDWTDLGYPHDKRLYQFWIDYDMYGQTVDLLLDIIKGKNGNTIQLGIQTFTLAGAGRAQVTIPINDGTIVKKVRLRPGVPTTDYEIFSWNFEPFEKYPPDVSLFTPFSDSGYPCEKIYRGYTVEINTGGIDCNITTEVDGVSIGSPAVVNTSDADRARMITLPTSVTNPIIGKIARILLNPTTSSGLAQLFKGPDFDFWKEPCQRNYWDSGELTFGTQSFKMIKQLWIEYLCAQGILVDVYVSGGVLLKTTALPAHVNRDIERFFINDAVGSVLNKSKVYRILIRSSVSTSPYKFYIQGSRVEWLDQSGDQRSSYQQTGLSELTSTQG